jgi:hypothetical protein
MTYVKTSLDRKHRDTNRTTREVYSLINHQCWYYINFLYIFIIIMIGNRIINYWTHSYKEDKDEL